MNTPKHARRALNLCIATIIGLLGVGASTDADAAFYFPTVVRCDWGANVQQVLDGNFLSLPIELRLVGTCAGFNITQDDVIITARDGCPGAMVHGGIKANGVHRVKLRCITVTGAEDSPGVTILGGTASLEEVSIVGNGGSGLSLDHNAYVEVSRGVIRDNGAQGVYMKGSQASLKDTDVLSNRRPGIVAEQKSSLELVGGSVTNNLSGIRVAVGSSLVLSGTSVSFNSRSGVAILLASDASIAGAQITNNGQVATGSGFFVRQHSSVEISGGSTVSQNNGSGVYLDLHSIAEIDDTQVLQNNTNGIRVNRDSGAALGSGAYVDGNGSDDVACDDKEASIDIDEEAVVSSINCIDRDF